MNRLESNLQCFGKTNRRTRFRVWHRRKGGKWHKGILFYGNLRKATYAALSWTERKYETFIEKIRGGEMPE